MKVMSKVQILKKGDSCVRSVLRERVLLSDLQNPFIVNMWGAIQDDRNLYLVCFLFFCCFFVVFLLFFCCCFF